MIWQVLTGLLFAVLLTDDMAVFTGFAVCSPSVLLTDDMTRLADFVDCSSCSSWVC